MNLEYVLDAGQAVRSLLRRGCIAELVYTPGNATAYPLVFMPVGFDNADVWAAADLMDGLGGRSIFRHEHEYVERQEGWVLVSWLGHGSWLFHMPVDPDVPRPILAAGFIAEKLGPNCTLGDGDALAALFRVVAFGELGPQVVAA